MAENRFQDARERDDVAKILAELDLLHPARAAFLRGVGTLDISLLVQRADLRRRLEVAYHAALERYLALSRRNT